MPWWSHSPLTDQMMIAPCLSGAISGPKKACCMQLSPSTAAISKLAQQARNKRITYIYIHNYTYCVLYNICTYYYIHFFFCVSFSPNERAQPFWLVNIVGNVCWKVLWPHCFFKARLASNLPSFAKACALQHWQVTLPPFRHSLWLLWPCQDPSGTHSWFQHLDFASPSIFSEAACRKMRPLQPVQTR